MGENLYIQNLALKNGHWVKAKELPYYPSIWERIGHFLGKHVWTIGVKPRHCVMCGIVR